MATKQSLELFRKAAVEVPAYRKFLAVHGVNPDAIKSPSDLGRLPRTSKSDYLQRYPLSELVWSGGFKMPLIFCATSGSTGAPFYFPRQEELSWQYSWIIQDFLERRQQKNQKPVLVVLAFGMGVWIGGVITLRAFEIAIQRMNFPASILPVGYNKTETIKAFKQLSPQFDQTILIGYPPFVKELVDEAVREKIDLRTLNMRLVFAAEAFTETFRDYLCKKTGADPVIDTLNIYGSADIGAMAAETPTSILIRRLALKRPMLFQDIFGQIEKTPTLAQFDPKFIDFEEEDGEILLTGNSATPLIRYAIGDHGGVISYDTMTSILERNGLDLEKELKKAGVPEPKRKYPFVFVYERVNFSVTLHGINIFPEFIKEGLLQPELSPFLTERFAMATKFDRRHNQYLEINLELQKDVNTSRKLNALAKKVIRQSLIEKSSEFAEVSKSRNSQKLIKLHFWRNGHPRYFGPGVKQKWVIPQG